MTHASLRPLAPPNRATLAGVLLIAAVSGPATAQRAPDALSLAALQDAAVRRDPRLRQIALHEYDAALHLRDLEAERLPALTGEGQAQLQSAVTHLDLRLPGGIAIPTPSRDTYDARVAAQQRLFDATIAPRRAVIRAGLAQSGTQLRTTLFALRQQVNDAFFQAASLDAHRRELRTAIADLDAQLGVARDRVLAGGALPSDTATLLAVLLRRQQDVLHVDAERGAALRLLADLTGRSFVPTDSIPLPDLTAPAARARSAVGSADARPELANFQASRELLARQADALDAQLLPRVSAFVRAGYGRPGLNFLSNAFDGYWLAGVQVQWTPWNWGTTERGREALAVQSDIIATEEAAFREGVRRAVIHDEATMARLQDDFATDERVVALREAVLREARVRFGEGVITSAEFVDRQTDLLDARLALAAHRVDLAQARARYLTTLGLEVR